jgi:hypothetical protein
MTTQHSFPPASADLGAAIRAALARIPPLWPLRHFVAVNPFVGLVDRPFSQAAELLQRVAGAAPFCLCEFVLGLWREYCLAVL